MTFRCPTRKECIDLYDARFQGLDEAVKLTGGDFCNRTDGNWFWTAERDADPRYASTLGISAVPTAPSTSTT